jgi:plastocyanin
VDLASIVKELEGVTAADVPLSEGPVTVELADFELKPRLFRVKAGDVDFVFQNPSTHAHNYRVTAWDNHENIIYPGPKIGASKTREATITLEPGIYYVLCNLSDHEERGMVGKLIVEP